MALSRLSRLLALAVLATLLAGLGVSAAPPNDAPATHIVVFAPGQAAGDAAADLARAHGLGVTHVYRHALQGMAAVVPPARLAALAADPRVAYVEPNLVAYAVGQTVPTGVDRIDAEGAPTTPVDVDIAILDTGIDLDHPDLNVQACTDCARGVIFFRGCRDGSGDDGHGHGTHVAGIAAALNNDLGVVGVAPGARLWAVRVLDNSGSGYLSWIIGGIDWVTSHAGEIEVANLSLGWLGHSEATRTAIQGSVAKGIVYVVAAGNDSKDVYGADGALGGGDDFEPAAYPEVATISALNDSDGQPGGIGPANWAGADDSFAYFSNHSASVVQGNPVSSPGKAIDLLLPGVDIYSTYKGGGYATMSGTSMASPHAAGLAALYVAANGRAHDAAGVYAIRQALIDAGKAQDDPDYGLAVQNDPDGYCEPIGWAGLEGPANQAPSVSIAAPADGSTVSGLVPIRILATDAEDPPGSLAVSWDVDGGAPQPAAYNGDSGYYEATWDSTAVGDGPHTINAQAADSGGRSASAAVEVTVDNVPEPPGASMHVGSIDLSLKRKGVNYEATAAVLVVSGDDLPVRDATVTGDWTLPGGVTVTGATGVTGADGVALLVSPKVKPKSGDQFTFTVTGVAHSGYTYDPAANVETSDTVTVP